jgi:hypothetical protein
VDGGLHTWLYSYDVGRDVWHVSDPWLSLHGLPAGHAFTTQDLLERVHPEDRSSTTEWLEARVAEPGSSSHTYRMRAGQRSGRRMRLVAQTVDDPVHQTRRMHGFLVDISADISRWQSEAVSASSTHRATIEQAKGALMFAFCVDEETAFRMLAGYSQRRNAKLRDVATFIADAIADPHFANADHPVESLVDVITLVVDERTHLRSAPAGDRTVGPGRDAARSATA